MTTNPRTFATEVRFPGRTWNRIQRYPSTLRTAREYFDGAVEGYAKGEGIVVRLAEYATWEAAYRADDNPVRVIQSRDI